MTAHCQDLDGGVYDEHAIHSANAICVDKLNMMGVVLDVTPEGFLRDGHAKGGGRKESNLLSEDDRDEKRFPHLTILLSNSIPRGSTWLCPTGSSTSSL